MISFSIITCTFNAQEMLPKTLDSVYEQSYCNFQHIIIDGLSKDNTMTLINNYVDRVKERENKYNVIVVSEPDKGLYDAMNKALKLASNNYVVYLNAGDVFTSDNTLETIANCVGEGEKLPGVLYGDTNIVNSKGEFIRKRRLSPPQKMNWKSFKQGMLVCHQAFYALTSIAKKTPYNLSYRLSADVDWCIRIMKTAKKENRDIRNVNATIANFMDGGLTTTNHKKSLKERFWVMTHHYGLITTLMMHAWFIVRKYIKK